MGILAEKAIALSVTLSGGALFASWKLLQFPSSLIVKIILAIFMGASAQQDPTELNHHSQNGWYLVLSCLLVWPLQLSTVLVQDHFYSDYTLQGNTLNPHLHPWWCLELCSSWSGLNLGSKRKDHCCSAGLNGFLGSLCICCSSYCAEALIALSLY